MPPTEADISRTLYLTPVFRHGERRVRLAFLLPQSLWRPLRAPWWRGKQVSVIGGDEGGNFILRHCDGSVRLWDHARGADEVLAASVGAFLQGLTSDES